MGLGGLKPPTKRDYWPLSGAAICDLHTTSEGYCRVQQSLIVIEIHEQILADPLFPQVCGRSDQEGCYQEADRGGLHRFYQRTQRFGFANNGPAIFQFDDALMLPIAKAAVDLFTRSARHFRQFAL